MKVWFVAVHEPAVGSAGGLTKFPVLEVPRTLGAPWPDRRP
jgi:hypothetical protein